MLADYSLHQPFFFMSSRPVSAAARVGTEEQRVQRQAHDVASLPQPTTAE